LNGDQAISLGVLSQARTSTRKQVNNPRSAIGNRHFETGAGSRIRTDDLLITNQLLYQLSYAGICLGKTTFLEASVRTFLYAFSIRQQVVAKRSDELLSPSVLSRFAAHTVAPSMEQRRRFKPASWRRLFHGRGAHS
jgi:hypothetical protein